MENTPETIKPTPPINITEDIQVSLNRLGRDLETHAESGIRIGKELIYLKEITPHGKYRELAECAYGLKRSTITNYMQVAEKFGQNANQLAFSSTVLIELSRLAHDNCPNKEIYADLKKCLAEAFFVMLPLVHGIETGKLTLPEGQTENDLHRIIGGFFAGNPAVLGANLSMKQIEHKTDKPEE